MLSSIWDWWYGTSQLLEPTQQQQQQTAETATKSSIINSSSGSSSGNNNNNRHDMLNLQTMIVEQRLKLRKVSSQKLKEEKQKQNLWMDQLRSSIEKRRINIYEEYESSSTTTIWD